MIRSLPNAHYDTAAFHLRDRLEQAIASNFDAAAEGRQFFGVTVALVWSA
jgi:hypothetical protein